MKKLMTIMTAILLVAVLAACGGAAPADNPSTTGGGSPEDAAKAFMEATFAGDGEAMRAAVCAAQRAQITDEVVEQMASAMGGAAAAGAEMDYSGLTYTASDVTENSANVAIGGNITVTVAGQSQSMDASQMGMPPLPVTREDGAWKVCQAA